MDKKIRARVDLIGWVIGWVIAGAVAGVVDLSIVDFMFFRGGDIGGAAAFGAIVGAIAGVMVGMIAWSGVTNRILFVRVKRGVFIGWLLRGLRSGAIVGAIVGAVVFLIFLFLFWLFRGPYL